ncbi:hypothetical protein HJC23_008871 [Cyclotella cryptica]|uniref:E3 ubiquitin protein ligase n=1 Tax=Cyclotella cryptica TaxID=29204 RepID=A0ABD3PBB4_9STRA|eukprot:CCRYP_015967-RA/>CCRYP_015967-RA protein AED:0.04 eAED:0.04 QI:690/1/1/1/1/1/7/161/1000
MKRALAERVKQEQLSSPLETPPTTPHTFSAKPPPNELSSKLPGSMDVSIGDVSTAEGEGQSFSSIPRRSPPPVSTQHASPLHPAPPQSMEVQSIEPQLTMPPPSVPSSAAKKRPRSPNALSSGNVTSFQSEEAPKKRPGRPRKHPPTTNSANSNNRHSSAHSDSDDEADPSGGPFFLKYQNSALSSELYAYRRRIYLLEREREWRRRECEVVSERVRLLEGVWRGMEEGLLGGETSHTPKSNGESIIESSTIPIPPPASTGSGTDVETVPSVLSALKDLVSSTPLQLEPPTKKSQHHVNTLNNFESYSNGSIHEKDDEDLIIQKRNWEETNEFAAALTSRAKRLHSAILKASSATATDTEIELKQEIIRLEAEIKVMDEKLEEIAKARNEAVASERRVRRGLYRLASGRMTLEDVLKAVEKEDNGVSFMETIAMLDGLNNKKSSFPDGATSGIAPSSMDATSSPSFSAATSKESSGLANAEELNTLKKSLQDVQAVSESREKQIAELLREKEEHLKQINSLLLPKENGTQGPDDDAIQKSPAFIEMSTKLGIAENRVKELEAQYENTRQRWAVTKGDLDLAKKTIAEMEGKHERRWNELISQFSESDSASSAPDSNGAKDCFGSAKKIAELESKLKQSIDAVNRMEALRATLSESYKMNEALQSKLDDLKNKNAKIMAEKSAARAAQGAEPLASPQAAAASSSKRTSAGGSSSGDPSIDKLQRDYKRARKELAAAVMSKDQAKLKQERAEKERDALMKTNARLLKQSSEKDDMNAKSLSTILHLKQRNDELEKENAIIKQKSQAAQQLSLAARLASNAKDRVGEEALKEKELIEESVKKLQDECSALRQETERAKGLLSQSNEKVASVTKELDAARSRCDDLVADSTKKEEEKKQMMESLAVVKKEAVESAKKAVAASATSSSSGVRSDFTMEQLTAQVKYLSDRMNCPVCNSREKKCILLRCRHMFCQKCVDENIKNRSRKCPACAQRFDTKDVAEIWL